MKSLVLKILLIIGVLAISVTPLSAVEVLLRDIAHIQGLRENQLIGYGLVVGLQGTGDSRYSQVTSKSMANMLEKFGLNLSKRDFSSRNSAAVMVTATLMPFMAEGDRIDVKISSIGDAKSLQGGTLVMTAMIAGNQKIYAYAQGAVSVGGYYAGTRTQSIKKNVTTVGVISGGAIVEKTINSVFLNKNNLTFTLDRTDFVLASQVVTQLNTALGAGVAKTANGTDINLIIPDNRKEDPVTFIADALRVKVDFKKESSVVVDERTGTIVVGGEVLISKVAISHGGLHIAVAGETKISQPMPLTMGQTVIAEQLSIRADELQKELVALPEGTTIEELVRALNAIGTLPRDVIVILQNLKAVGALHAKIVTR